MAATGRDPSEIDTLFNQYALLPPMVYKEKVLDVLNQISIDRGIDVTEGFINKAFELQGIISNNKELQAKSKQELFNKFISREGYDE